MLQVQHFVPPAGLRAPLLAFAARVGDLLFVSGILIFLQARSVIRHSLVRVG